MALQKQPIEITFSGGIETKTDPDQVPLGKFLDIQNVVFDVGGLFKKRNGFGLLSTLPNSEQTNITTLNDSIVATGIDLLSYSQTTNEWLNKGTVRPVDVSVVPIIRNSASQTAPDAAVSSTGLALVTFKEGAAWYYQISDSVTGEDIVARTALPANSQSARSFILGRYFLITYMISGAPRLQYIAIPMTMPSSPHAPATFSSAVSSAAAGYDGLVLNNNLYLAWDASDGGGAVRIAILTSTLQVTSSVAMAGHTATLCSVAADTSGNTATIYVSFWDDSDSDAYVAAFSQNLVQTLAPTQFLDNTDIQVLTSIGQVGSVLILYELVQSYSYDMAIRSDQVAKKSCTSAGVVSSQATVLRSVGLASKPFIESDAFYILVAYGGALQPSYFLSDTDGNIVSRLAYSNGNGYADTQILPTVSIKDNFALVPYILKDQLTPVNKSQGVVSPSGIYAQTGINLAAFELISPHQYSSEIASALHLTGGQLWMYDGIKPVEHSFHVWPEDVEVTTDTSGGNLADQTYFYAVTYEWTDASGNIHRSAPSVPVSQVTSGGDTSTNTIDIPTLRLTYKVAPNSVRIVIYRWSTAQQVYYQLTSITAPLLNDTSMDSVEYVDTIADADILGNLILYTTGGVLENIAAPPSVHSALFKSRLFLIDAEDDNLLWYSKQVIESTPVELSDLQTIFVAPTTGAQGSTGGMKALSAMDDKLIIFKKDAIYYVTGNGPDITGANNDFSEAVFITGAVGCANPNSIVLTPMGLMFQSDKGIWQLGRDLSTKYIGADVQAYNTQVIKSGLVIPGTNQVRFTLDSGLLLVYDYYYNQWGTFTDIPALSACLYQGLHTYLNNLGQLRQETPGKYLDNTSPVLMSWTTSWIRLVGLQNFQRAYYMFLLSNYLTPHKLTVQIAYDYNPSFVQSLTISPDNFSPNYGDEALWGSGSPWGGPSNSEQWEVYFRQQKCQSIQIAVSEQYDPTKDVAAGAGLTFSGINVLVGLKGAGPKLPASRRVG